MARSFNGTSDRADCNNSGNGIVPATSNWSYSCWVNAQALNNQPIWSQYIGTPSNGRILTRVSTANFFSLFLGSDANGLATTELLTASSVTTGLWAQLGASRNGRTFTIYYKGLSENSVTDPSSIALRSILNTGNMFAFFTGSTTTYNSTSGASQPTFGKILLADLAFWNTTLTALEFNSLGQGQRPPGIRSGSLLDWHPLDGIQSPEPDISGNKFNAALNGTSLSFGPPIAPFTPRRPRILPNVAATSLSFLAARAMRANQVYTGYATQ